MSNADSDQVLATVGLGCVLGAIVALLVIPAVIVRGYVLATLWAWFIVPTFGLPSLTVPLAIGLAMVAAVLVPRHGTAANQERKGWGKLVGESIALVCGSLLALPLGWLVLQFV